MDRLRRTQTDTKAAWEIPLMKNIKASGGPGNSSSSQPVDVTCVFFTLLIIVLAVTEHWCTSEIRNKAERKEISEILWDYIHSHSPTHTVSCCITDTDYSSWGTSVKLVATIDQQVLNYYYKHHHITTKVILPRPCPSLIHWSHHHTTVMSLLSDQRLFLLV